MFWQIELETIARAKLAENKKIDFDKYFTSTKTYDYTL